MTISKQSGATARDAPWELSAPPAGFYADPYPHYRALHAQGPVVRASDGSLLVSGYAEVARIYRDIDRFSSDKQVEFRAKFGGSPLFEHHTTSLVFNDSPYHRRVRSLIVGALSPRAISALATGLEHFCEQLAAGLAGRGECDAVHDFAAAVPLRIIGDMFVVGETDRPRLRHWSLAILKALEPAPGAETLAIGNDAVSEFSAFLEGLIAERRRHPGDPERDLLTRLIEGSRDGIELTGNELVHNAIFLLNAGHETTTNLIGNALHILASAPDVRSRLTNAPHLIPSFIEEVLRFESPNQLGNRRCSSATEIAGVAVPAGTPITLMIGAANRDPAIFVEPDDFRLERTPNRHLAFGAGGHQCAGLTLARVEGIAAISAWLRHVPDFELAGAARWQARARFRGLERLPLRWS